MKAVNKASRITRVEHAREAVPTVKRYSEAEVPTEYGRMRTIVYRETGSGDEHCALVFGDVKGYENVLIRVHSECFTGEVLHSYKCDCREQLDSAFRKIARAKRGAVLYLRQEGRGIGLGNKIKAYALQAQGVDTVDANRLLGFEDDLRTYRIATDMIVDLGILSVALLTNNPLKVEALTQDGVNVVKRVPMRIQPNAYNADYLETKRARMGHILERSRKPKLAQSKSKSSRASR